MNVSRAAAGVYGAVSAVVVAFQLALAAGAPWGEYAMGGAFPGRFPPALRVAAVVQAGLITIFAVVVVSRAGIALPSWSRRLIWVVVAFGAVAVVLNLITPSVRERAIWAPIALLLFSSSLIVATRSQ